MKIIKKIVRNEDIGPIECDACDEEFNAFNFVVLELFDGFSVALDLCDDCLDKLKNYLAEEAIDGGRQMSKKVVYVLTYITWEWQGVLGVFSSLKKAKNAIEKIKKINDDVSMLIEGDCLRVYKVEIDKLKGEEINDDELCYREEYYVEEGDEE